MPNKNDLIIQYVHRIFMCTLFDQNLVSCLNEIQVLTRRATIWNKVGHTLSTLARYNISCDWYHCGPKALDQTKALIFNALVEGFIFSLAWPKSCQLSHYDLSLKRNHMKIDRCICTIARYNVSCAWYIGTETSDKVSALWFFYFGKKVFMSLTKIILVISSWLKSQASRGITRKS